MRIAELYRSNQGEGALTGTSSVFIRASGCNLRCRFCDTPFTSWNPEGDDWSLDAIVDKVTTFDCQHVVITGGEPMLFSEMIPLTHALKELGKHITIETAGTLYLPVEADLMSVSPKLANSTPSVDVAGAWQARHERTRHAPDVIRQLADRYQCQFKFVIDTPADVDEVGEYLKSFPTLRPDQVWMMPQGTDLERLNQIAEWLVPRCQQHGYHFCPRKHIEWYGATRGT